MTLNEALEYIAQLKEENSQLGQALVERDQTIATLLERIEKLEVQLRQDSSNSSRPPSSDPPWKEGKKKGKTGKKRGGQPGHKGHHRERLPAERVDHVQPYYPELCGACEQPLQPEDVVGEAYHLQTVELPEVRAEVTEHCAYALRCRGCGTVTRAPLPTDVQQSVYGPRLMATVALLSGAFRLSKRSTVRLLELVWQVRLSPASVCQCEQTVSETLAEPYEEAGAFIERQPFAHADETSWRQQWKRTWLWIAATPWVILFCIQARRNMQAAQKLLGSFAGVLLTDRYGAYLFHSMGKRQICWAHLLREFVALEQLKTCGAAIGQALLEHTILMFRAWHKVRDGTLTRAQFQEEMKPIEQAIVHALKQGRSSSCSLTAGKCKHILRYRKALFTFVRVEGIEPTNNAAERGLRHPVLGRKISFGTQSDAGSRFLERIWTVVLSLRAQNRPVLPFLLAALSAKRGHGKMPSLLPSSALTTPDSVWNFDQLESCVPI